MTWWGKQYVTNWTKIDAWLFLVFCNRPTDISNAVNDIPSTITTFHAGYSVKYSCLSGYVGWDWDDEKECRIQIDCRTGTTTSECTFLGQWTFATLKCTRKMIELRYILDSMCEIF